MKFNFKRITAIGASLLMAGMTMGIAAAATFPAPFVTNNVADVAIVYGTGVGVSPTDMVEAGNIQTTLGESMPSTGGSTVVDGDSYKFEKTSTKFHLGDYYVNVSTTLDEDQLPTLLAEGKYTDDDNDEIDYTQKITMAALPYLHMFDDGDYAEDAPTVGFRIPSGQAILSYQIDFSDALLMSDTPTTNMPLMGKVFYVLSNTSTTMTFLDSAASTIVSADEVVTLDVEGTTYTVSASIFDTANSKVKLLINGETTNLLGSTETQKLSDGSYVGVKEVIVQNFQGGVNQAEFSIGKGKLKITDGGATEVQINDNAVSGLTGDFNLSGDTLSRISLSWAADDDLFIAEDSYTILPGFESLKLSYGGLTYPSEEIIEVKQGGTTYAVLNDFPLKDGAADINFLYGNSTWFQGVGKDATHKLLTDDNGDGNMTFDGNNIDEYFVASWTDTNDAESYLLKFNNFVVDNSENKTDLSVYKDGAWVVKKSKAKATDQIDIGQVSLTVGQVNKLGSIKNVEVWNTSANTATSITSFNTLYSENGLTVYLPWRNTTTANLTAATSTAVAACTTAVAGAGAPNQVGELGFAGIAIYNGTTSAIATSDFQNETTCTTNQATFALKMVEEDKSENKYSGDHWNVTLGWDSSTTKEVEVTSIEGEEVTFVEIGDTDVWRSFMYSALATEMLWNKPSSGQKSIKLTYHGDEVAADVYITSPDATISGTNALGNVLVTDAEIDNVKTKNLIIVGGSCINSAAAGLLGSACGPSFTESTGIGAGQFLIQSFGDAYTTGKVALLVAGYELADTKNAATYLRTQTVDTTAGNKYVGTSSTEATLQVA